MYDFFISHSSLDKNDVVVKLEQELKNNKYSIWYDESIINSGKNINQEITEGLKKSYCVLVILTKNFFKSNWGFFELGQVINSKEKRIVPIVYDVSNDELNYFLSIIGNTKYLKADANIMKNLKFTLLQIKNDNEYLSSLEQLYSLQKKLNRLENINVDILCLSLKDYLSMQDSMQGYSINAAKKCVLNICNDVLKRKMNELEINANLYTDLEKFFSYNIIEYVKFILETKNFCIETKNDYILINKALYNIIFTYINNKYPIHLNERKIEIINPEDLTYEDFMEMYKIDKLVLREDLIASIETSYGWYKYNNYTHIGIRDQNTKELVGYFSILPITDDLYKKILSGNFKDKDFNEDGLLQYNFENFYRLYVAAVAIHPDYQNTNAFNLLYTGLINLIISLAKERNIYFFQVIAEASTKQGEKFCKLMGMKKILETIENTDVYSLTLIPPDALICNHKTKELIELLNIKYNEYKDFFNENF
ncbi:toll/interleukin-1 receptor domain-containing protein [Thomasclavelia cocleata]|jgi:hypothetical protein|nr:toll/interleukin-1 receptor domain-containing protein [Thomasclavelia cocleata]MCI9654193.1 toll/interleukin-1 receptor domain-containing protein [Acholeplasmatales bacterium]